MRQVAVEVRVFAGQSGNRIPRFAEARFRSSQFAVGGRFAGHLRGDIVVVACLRCLCLIEMLPGYPVFLGGPRRRICRTCRGKRTRCHIQLIDGWARRRACLNGQRHDKHDQHMDFLAA